MISVLRWLASFMLVFASFALAGWLALFAWDRTHQPKLPDSWKSPPATKARSH